MILGPNGIGKSTTAKIMLQMLPCAALVDSDWCRAMNPYEMNTVIENIYALIKNYFLCPEIETIIFPYGFHGDRIQRFEKVKTKLCQEGIEFEIFTVILTCSLEENIRRAKSDMRDDELVKRGVLNTYDIYDELAYIKIDTTDMTADKTAERIIELFNRCILKP